MSSVTSCWLIVPSSSGSHRGSPESRVKSCSAFIHNWVRDYNEWPVEDGEYPTIDLLRDDWRTLQGGSKVAGMAAIWFGLNHASYLPELLESLRGFEDAEGSLLVWQHENDDELSLQRIY